MPLYISLDVSLSSIDALHVSFYLSISTYLSIPLYISLYLSIPPYTSLHLFLSLYTSLHLSTSLSLQGRRVPLLRMGQGPGRVSTRSACRTT